MAAGLSQLDCPSPNQPAVRQLATIDLRPEMKLFHYLAYTAKIQTHRKEMLIATLLCSEVLHHGHNPYRVERVIPQDQGKKSLQGGGKQQVSFEHELSPTALALVVLFWKSLGCGTLKEEAGHWQVKVKDS